jgi:hypothetical protein
MNRFTKLGLMLDVIYSRARISRSYQTLGMFFLSFAEILVLVAAGYAVLKGELTLGGLFDFMNAFWKLNGCSPPPRPSIKHQLT